MRVLIREVWGGLSHEILKLRGSEIRYFTHSREDMFFKKKNQFWKSSHQNIEGFFSYSTIASLSKNVQTYTTPSPHAPSSATLSLKTVTTDKSSCCRTFEADHPKRYHYISMASAPSFLISWEFYLSLSCYTQSAIHSLQSSL